MHSAMLLREKPFATRHSEAIGAMRGHQKHAPIASPQARSDMGGGLFCGLPALSLSGYLTSSTRTVILLTILYESLYRNSSSRFPSQGGAGHIGRR